MKDVMCVGGRRSDNDAIARMTIMDKRRCVCFLLFRCNLCLHLPDAP